jgi:glycosyltransferase involved in cell wall biosynthesis
MTFFSGLRLWHFASSAEESFPSWLRWASSAFQRRSVSDPVDAQANNRPIPGEPAMTSTKETERSTAAKAAFLAFGPHALPSEFQERTVVLVFRKDTWWEKALVSLRLTGVARRSQGLRRAWAFFRQAPKYDVVVTTGTLDGLTFALLQRLRGTSRPVHVMYDCLWYGGSFWKRAWMRACLKTVDCCVVWASVERERYAGTYDVPIDKFIFIPHHHSLLRYTFEIGDEGYLFTGGNADRDYGFFFEAVKGLAIPCLLATNRPHLLEGLQIPANVRIVSATAAEFRQLIARARIVVMPMRASLLHAGAQQTILNAMYMGKPVILTDPAGGADYIAHERNGLLVPYGDVKALQENIRIVWERPELAREMGQRAQETAVPLTTERCNAEMWELAEKVVAERRSSAAKG